MQKVTLWHIAAYLLYVLKHRWFVLVECWRRGLYWRGLVHDISKLRPSEFFPYARFFALKNPRDKTGYYKPTDTGDTGFEAAWLRHVHRNDHHWQHWVMPTEDGVKIYDMPDAAIREMVCDWYGAGRAQRSEATPQEWWEHNNHKMQLADATRVRIEELLGSEKTA